MVIPHRTPGLVAGVPPQQVCQSERGVIVKAEQAAQRVRTGVFRVEAPARFDRVRVDLASTPGDVVLSATGSVVAFDGFLRIYHEGRDDDDGAEFRLPAMKAGEPVFASAVHTTQRFTAPQPRYTEAGLVRWLEEIGIGCSNFPACRFTRPLAPGTADGGEGDKEPKPLGEDPHTGLRGHASPRSLRALRPERRGHRRRQGW